MAGNLLTAAASLQCPHGAPVQITPAGPRPTLDGVPLVTEADVFAVLGCPFILPTVPPIPSPCVVVRWSVPDLRAKAGGAATLSQGSVGLCYSAMQVPQGPVVINATQPRASSQ